MKKNLPGKITILFLFSCLGVWFTFPENASALPGNQVKSTVFASQGTRETAIIKTIKPAKTTLFVLHNPERVVLDIHSAFLPEVSRIKEIRGNIISGIRTSQYKKDVVRVVVDINKDTPYVFKVQKREEKDTPEIEIILSPDDTLNQQNGTPAPTGLSRALLNDAGLDDIFEETEINDTPSDLSISGLFHGKASVQANENDTIENNSAFRNRILIEAKYKNMVTASALSDYLYWGSENSSDDYEVSLYEAKWEKTEKKYGISLGKQILRWGKTDQVSPIDTLNPEDFREFILPDYEDRKIPVWMANARFFSDAFTLEGVIVPFFEPSKLDYFNTNWAVFGHIKKELLDSLPSQELKAYINRLAVHETDPGDEMEFALRLQTTVREIDMGVTFHRMTEDIPFFKSFPIKNLNVQGDFSDINIVSSLNPADFTNEPIVVEYQKTTAAGFEFETTWAEFGVRGEAVWKEYESFLTASLTSTRHHTFTYVVGADYTSVNNTYVNLQFLHSHIDNFSDDILYFDQDTLSLLGEVRVDLISDWMQGAVKFNLTLNNNSHYVSPYLKYTYITNLECIAGTSLFFGDKETWFGRFKDYDLFFLNFSYRF